MRHGLHQIYSLLGELPDPGGFPLRALMAGVAVAEGGDPDAWVAHDPPNNPRAAPSSGLYQVHQTAYPTIYANTEKIRLAALSDEEKILAMTELARPIMKDMMDAAAQAGQILAARGVSVSPLDIALFVDAAWQSGADHVVAWARRTRTGDAREIVNPRRTTEVEAALRTLAGDALGAMSGAAIAALMMVGLGVVAVALKNMEDWFS